MVMAGASLRRTHCQEIWNFGERGQENGCRKGKAAAEFFCPNIKKFKIL